MYISLEDAAATLYCTNTKSCRITNQRQPCQSLPTHAAPRGFADQPVELLGPVSATLLLSRKPTKKK